MVQIDLQKYIDDETQQLELNTPRIKLHLITEENGCVTLCLSLRNAEEPTAHVWMDKEDLEQYADAFDIVSKTLRVWIKRSKEENDE